MEKIAIENDIYLYFWVYFLKPIVNYDNTYEIFLEKNSWVKIPENKIRENKKYIISSGKSRKITWYHIFLSSIFQFF